MNPSTNEKTAPNKMPRNHFFGSTYTNGTDMMNHHKTSNGHPPNSVVKINVIVSI